RQGEYKTAETCYRRALSTDENNAAAWNNLGFALRRQERFDESVEAFQRAYQLDDADDESDVDAFFNLAIGYSEVGRNDEALRLFEANLSRRPSPNAHFNYGLMLLSCGYLEEAWRHHEFRWLTETLASKRPSYGKPVWNGQA